MYRRSFLKWAGNKHQLIDEIKAHMPPTTKLIEPFAGSGAVFLGTQFSRYVLNDINADLINTFEHVKAEPIRFVSDLAKLFSVQNNTQDCYYHLREQFNATQDKHYKALLFVYLNRHGFQGLCRYNLRGYFNVPFGHYKKVYFPEQEILSFAHKAQRASFTNTHFSEAFRRARKGDLIYCDPPYVPLSATANFTSYSTGGFTLADQRKLALLAEKARDRGVNVILSNHNTEPARKLYANADAVSCIDVRRSMNAKLSTHKKAKELIVCYLAQEVVT